ncbi:hypothetical protein [Ferrimonas marina]|uniref:hypothetical protein n=1 Tax=Ferrimonas marina TaxID=299255 RepID=UPI0008333E17|nr:hypothetical protein [Ferrimonas marina]
MGLILAAVLLAWGLWHWPRLTTPDLDMVLSCRGELLELDDQGEAGPRFQVLANFLLQGDRASILYRYFSEQGDPLGELSMRGQILSEQHQGKLLALSLSQSALTLEAEQTQMPQHMRNMAAFGQRNQAQGETHTMTLRFLERDEEQDVAILLFLPNCAVCGCNMTPTG